jgi:hypothetical protein
MQFAAVPVVPAPSGSGITVSLDASGEVVRARASEAGRLSSAIYEETQLFPLFVYALLLVGLAVEVGAVGSALMKSGQSMQANLGIIAAMAACNALVMNLLVLRTRVDATELYLCLGWLPLFWTRIPLESIQDLRCVTYRPLRDAGGWGMRFGRFEDFPCRYWNARGNQGVLVVTAKHRYIVGSQRSEDLYRVLSRSKLNGMRP